MGESCHFVPVNSRWIDEWQPTEHPKNSLTQAIRYYAPADFLLLLEVTGLIIAHIEVNGVEIDMKNNKIQTSNPLLEERGTSSYLVQLRAEQYQ